jgi:hypothetical protein
MSPVHRKVGAEQDLARLPPKEGMSLIRTAAEQNLDVIEFLTRLAQARAPEDVPPPLAWNDTASARHSS